MNIRGLNQLKNELEDWQQEVLSAIIMELERIARPVTFTEFFDNPFNTEVSDYVEAIYLDKDTTIMLDTSFSDTKRKALESFMNDSEIDSWGLLGLLDGLKSTEP
jgi:hypothetical protein